MPFSSSNGEFTDPITALFTATSATCVTGLVLYDTWSQWSGFGQAVILLGLAQECGILIRNASNFATLGEGHFRIATQNDAQNELLVKSLEKLCM